MDSISKLDDKTLVRFGSIPINLFLEIHSKDIRNILLKKARYQKWIDENKNKIIDFLYREYSECEKKETKNLYLRLKRNIYNDRVTKVNMNEINKFIKIRRIYKLVELWHLLSVKIIELEEKGEMLLKKYDKKTFSKHLQLAKDSKPFMQAISLASPGMYEKLNNLQVKEKVDHKFYESLMKYLTRASLKTSPFSSFSINGLGKVVNDKDEFITYKDIGYKSFSRLNQSIILSDYFDNSENYIINPSSVIVHDNVIFIRRENSPFSLAKYNKESLMNLELNAIITFLISYKNNNSLKLKDYKELLIKNFIEISSSDIDSIIGTLCEIQFLIKNLTPDLESYKIYQEDLLSEGKSLQLAASTKFSKLTNDERSKFNKNLDISQEYSKHFIYEDTLAKNMFKISFPKYEKPLKTITQIHDLLPLFDTTLRMKFTLGELLRKKTGLGRHNKENLISFFFSILKEHNEFLYEDNLNNNPLNISTIDKLNMLRKIFLKNILENQTNETITLNENILIEINSEIDNILPSEIRHSSSMFFLQPSNTGNLYLNQITGGFGRSYSRFCNYDHSLYQRIRNKLLSYSTTNKLTFADIRFSFGVNGNIYPFITDQWIDYSKSNSKIKGKIGLEELSIYSCENNGLKCSYENADIAPLHLGMIGYNHLPIIYRLLASLTTFDYIKFPFDRILAKSLYKENEEVVCTIPSVEINGLILSRKQWRINNGILQKKSEELSNWKFFEYLENLFEMYRIPRKFYMKPESIRINVKLNKMNDIYKPQFIDLSEPVLINIFIKEIKNYGKSIIIEQINPSESELITLNDNISQLEFGIEVYK